MQTHLTTIKNNKANKIHKACHRTPMEQPAKNQEICFNKMPIALKEYHRLIAAIDALAQKNDIVNIAIDGKSGSGKSTLADLLKSAYDCNVFHMDDFFLRPEQKTAERLMEIGGNVDYIRFKEEVIEGLKTCHPFAYQIYDCSIQKLTDSITVRPKKINIIEGVYSLHPALRDIYHLKVFMTIDSANQNKRILERSGSWLYQRFINEWIPMENTYFNKLEIEKLADFIFTAES